MLKLSRIKETIRNGSFAWPGGYPLFFLMGDGECMHVDCVKDNWREIVGAHLRNQFHDRSWLCDAVDINYEDDNMICCQCDKPIESAYGEPDK